MVSQGLNDEERRELEALRAEKADLLEELEAAYLQMQKVLATTDHETRIAYEELQRRLHELEHTNEQLQETQHMLLHAERLSAMGQMAATIVHDINGPLAVITGHAELMLMKAADQYQREGLNTVLQAAWRLHDLAQNILHFSRQKYTEPAAVELSEKIEEMLPFLAPLLRRVQTTEDLASDLPLVMVDPSKLEQVLFNFLTNALDVLEQHPDARVEIRTGVEELEGLIAREEEAGWQTHLAVGKEAEEQRDPWVYVEIRDNGPGISAADMERIFAAFFTTKGEERGTGLGLAISRNIAESHRGTILAASREGVGTSFRLLLPPMAGAGARQRR